MSDWRDRLDPQLQAAVAQAPVVDFVNHEAFREAANASAARRAAEIDISGIQVVDRGVAAAGGKARVRVYDPGVAGLRPALLHLHGGGFVSGTPDTSHARMVDLTRELGIVIVSVDYRLAPEHPYPAALDDSMTALRWLVAEAGALGVDRDRVAVHGISAGGGLAAAIALRARGEVPLSFQFLSIPILDNQMASPSMVGFDDTPVWNRSVGELSWRHYLGALHDADQLPVQAAPARASIDDLRGLPPAYVAVMELDPLCDEGMAYASRLGEAGVSVEAHRFPGAFHGAVTAAPEAEVCRRYLEEEAAVLGHALGVSR